MPVEPEIRSPYASLRVKANAIWRGPEDITIPDLGGDTFYGWSTLSLELRPKWEDRLESRIVYANIYDVKQKTVILRAVYWDRVAARKAIAKPEQGESYNLMLPARFVKVPAEVFKGWLSDFDNVNVVINTPKKEDKKAGIRRLRIERDYAASIFEKVWQTENKKHSLLNQKWDSIWKQMSNILSQEPFVVNLDEDFWFVNPQVKYNFRTYQPDLLELENPQ